MSSANLERRRSSPSNPREKFPNLDVSKDEESFPKYDESGNSRSGSVRPLSPARTNGVLHSERWQASRKDNYLAWGDGHLNVAGPRQHGRHRSLSDAFRNIRTRKASVSENAHEIAEALKAPISLKILVGGFVAWKDAPADKYLRCSALSGI